MKKLLALVKRYHKRHGTAPPIRYILARAKINRTQFYRTYPGGIAEVCRLAGITAPEDRMRQVAKALDAKGNAANADHVFQIYRLMWTVGAKTPIEAFDMAIDEITRNRDKIEALETENGYFHALFGDDFFDSRCYAQLRRVYDHTVQLGSEGTFVEFLEECLAITMRKFGLSFEP